MGSVQPPEGLLSRLPADPVTGGPAWLSDMRNDAATSLRDRGLPTRRNEGWRFTPVKRVAEVPFEGTAPGNGADMVQWVDERFGDDGTRRLVLVNGIPVSGIPVVDALGELPGGVQLDGMSAVLSRAPESLADALGSAARHEHFAALNAVLFTDGVVLRVERGARVEQPIHLVHVAVPGAGPTAAYPRVVVVGGEASELSLIETFVVRGGGQHLTNSVTEVVLGDGARCDHTRVQEGASNAFHVGVLAARLGRDSNYTSRVVALGGALSRLDVSVRFEGLGGECTLDGVYHAAGREHVDHQLRVDHAAGRCTSHQTYRGIIDGAGRAVWDGTSVVRRDAQQSSAHQENRNLLLSDEATVNTKPHLEIDADDVSASHGATVGALDDAQLFYLRARGIAERHARDVLTFAFVAELLERIPHAPTVQRLEAALLERLPNGDAVREMLP